MNVRRPNVFRPIVLASLVLFGASAVTSPAFGQQRSRRGGVRAVGLPSAGMQVAAEPKLEQFARPQQRPNRAQHTEMAAMARLSCVVPEHHLPWDTGNTHNGNGPL